MAAVANTAQSNGINVTITSGNDSKHMTNSLHYTDNALDVRSKDFPSLESKLKFKDDVLTRLGKDYQGLLESIGKPNEHFHFEYDPVKVIHA